MTRIVCVAAVLVGSTGILLLLSGCDDSERCSACNGSGVVYIVDPYSGISMVTTCMRCNGRGELVNREARKGFWERMRFPISLGICLGLGAIGRAAYNGYKEYKQDSGS